ncbi:hypothetical protein [Coralloluteibacterium stylophorae]|uniref:Uncharacterized protein n=1 Tax=Coralloluteibacterium stylophorae TaxID=1776034 RepID=A0AAP2C7Z9_9GAMM|nr:hypothetical protein [Coralloluteibacterium stylophorae]MBS7456056.1 hypothetical protein [Coralloluteibacterium stylophorae]
MFALPSSDRRCEVQANATDACKACIAPSRDGGAACGALAESLVQQGFQTIMRMRGTMRRERGIARAALQAHRHRPAKPAVARLCALKLVDSV